jgi:aconitate hydratase
MALTLSEKIIKRHLAKGTMQAGEEITLNLDQCLLQDATGTMAWLEYEAVGVKKVKPFSVQYIDHNLLQEDNKNMDDHLFLQSIASRHGAWVSLPGNGISHHVHKERFTRPGKILIGSDSHTPTSGGAGMLAIGVGGMDVAVGMATGHYSFTMPSIVGVKLTGKLQPWCTAKDVILEILRRIDVDGGKGKILEFFGDGVKTLDVSERSTITNMGAETGATTSIFPSDAQTNTFFSAQQRRNHFVPLQADKGASYDDVMEIDLGKIEPLVACPPSPGKVKPIREVAGIDVRQSMIGSSTNSSYHSLMVAGLMLARKGKHVQTAFHVIPGSRQVLETIARDGGLMRLLQHGARIAEPSCNACIGMGNAPATDIVSVRSFPRNWEGRSGTDDDQVFLSSPETAVACAVKGELVDPRDLKMMYPLVKEPRQYVIDDKMMVKPTFTHHVRRGPNIKKIVYRVSLPDSIKGGVVIKVGDDISTDHILQAGAEVLPLRSNIPAISEYVFRRVDEDFVARAKKMKGGFIVGGDNYGQGSSREHAAIAPMYLGIQGVLVKSFARIHRSNLINFGIVPLTFSSAKDYGKVKEGDLLEVKGLKKAVSMCADVKVRNVTRKTTFSCSLCLSERERDIILKGGLLNYIKHVI